MLTVLSWFLVRPFLYKLSQTCNNGRSQCLLYISMFTFSHQSIGLSDASSWGWRIFEGGKAANSPISSENARHLSVIITGNLHSLFLWIKVAWCCASSLLDWHRHSAAKTALKNHVSSALLQISWTRHSTFCTVLASCNMWPISS